jgi:hypothetical protein
LLRGIGIGMAKSAGKTALFVFQLSPALSPAAMPEVEISPRRQLNGEISYTHAFQKKPNELIFISLK